MGHTLRVRALAIAGLALSAAGCGDTVTTRYATLAQYEDRGWLPEDILPRTAHDIVTVNDLDLNDSSGEFSFAPHEASAFFARLRPGAPVKAPYDHWNHTVQRHQWFERQPWTHARNGSVWVFFCDSEEGYCEYIMWNTEPPTVSTTAASPSN